MVVVVVVMVRHLRKGLGVSVYGSSFVPFTVGRTVLAKFLWFCLFRRCSSFLSFALKSRKRIKDRYKSMIVSLRLRKLNNLPTRVK